MQSWIWRLSIIHQSQKEAHHTTNKMEFPPHIFCLPYCLLSAAVLKKNTATTTEYVSNLSPSWTWGISSFSAMATVSVEKKNYLSLRKRKQRGCKKTFLVGVKITHTIFPYFHEICNYYVSTPFFSRDYIFFFKEHFFCQKAIKVFFFPPPLFLSLLRRIVL